MATYVKIEGYDNYQVNELGEVINTHTNRIIKHLVNPKTGYCTVGLRQDNKRTGYYVHHLVAKYFMEAAPAEGMELDHINGDKLDNSKPNLQWLTHHDNVRKRVDKTKTSSPYFGVSHAKGRWVAQLNIKQRPKGYIGNYATELEALYAYEAECKKHGVTSPNKLPQ